MELYLTRAELEHLPEAVIAAPAAELLQDPALAAGIWAVESTSGSSFLEQIDQHRECVNCLSEVLECLPDPTMTLENAVENQLITDRLAEKLYDSLASLLANEDYARLVLYLPFEFLPGRSWVPENTNLMAAIKNFKDSYKAAWYSQLSIHDVRANFVDGDVLESHLRTSDLPRVVKAAHLIPKLVESGMMELRDAIDLLKGTDDQLLKSNIADALLVLGDMGLITDEALAVMARSEDEDFRKMAHLVKGSRAKEQPQTTPVNPMSISAGLEAIAREQDVVQGGQMTERRAAWLKQQLIDKAVAALAEQIGDTVLEYAASHDAIRSVLLNNGDELAAQVFVSGIQVAVELAALSSHDKAQTLYNSFKDDLCGLWDREEPAVKEHLMKSFRRLYRLGIVDKEQLSDFGISLPKLAGPLSENLELIPEELHRLEKIAASIESTPELVSLIYPVISVGGSRLKGYGEESSDIDTTVFIRPGTSVEKAKELRQLLEAAYVQWGLDDVPAEFWLDETDGRLKVHDFADTDPLMTMQGAVIADSYWTHVLFGAAWIGDAAAIDELRFKLLPGYFYDAPEQKFGRSIRALYLERLEQDLLQYRLMHKGYERHYPPVKGIESPHSDLIDGKSMFWDSGYRRIASQLFINMVFLPKMKIGP